MKATILFEVMRNGVRKHPMKLVLAVAVMLPCRNAMAIPIVDLGTAGNSAILARAAITDAGCASLINTGDVGVPDSLHFTALPAFHSPAHPSTILRFTNH